MERIIAASRSSSFDLDVALRLYDRLNELPAPWFAANRMKLPCIAFKLPSFSLDRTRPDRVYRANTSAFGMVEMKTSSDLSGMNSLYLVHPWLDSLLDHEDIQSGAFAEDDDDSSLLPGSESPSPPSPVYVAPMDKETRARRLVARLRQPFGALLVRLESMGRRVVGKRVAADSLITVQFQENVSLADVLDNVRTIDVL